MDLLREIPDTLEQGCFATRLPDGSVAMMVTGNDTEFNALENVRLLNPEEEDPKRHIYLRIFSHRNTTWVNNPDKTKDPLSNDLSKLPNIGKDGYLERLPDGRVVCFSKGEKKVMEYGSECLNPTAPEAEQIYRKIFSKLKIYLPNEYERAIKEVLGEEPDRFIMSINGYSSLKVKERTDWGLGADEYEAGCEDLLYATIAGLRKRFMNRFLSPAMVAYRRSSQPASYSSAPSPQSVLSFTLRLEYPLIDMMKRSGSSPSTSLMALSYSLGR